MKTKALVTGGAGFIGSNLAKKLVEKNWDVTVIDNLRTGKREFVPEGARFLEQQVGSIETLTLLNKETFDFVFHLAAAPSVPESVNIPMTTHQINVEQTLLLMSSLRDRCGRFIFTSTSAVYGEPITLPISLDHPRNPKSPYALHKAIIEDYCKLFSELYKMDAICLRYFNVYGPHQLGKGAYANAISAWLYAIKNNLKLRSDGDGTQTRDLVFVEDVAEANVLAALSSKTWKGECFNVGNGNSFSNNEILNKLKAKFPAVEIEHAPARAGDVKHTLADITKTTEALGYVPRVNLEEGLERTIEWWRL